VTPAILTLIMSGCDRSITTDAAFTHLRGIVELLVVDDSRRLTHADVAAIRAGTFAPRRQQR
jgi:hypothetical protein